MPSFKAYLTSQEGKSVKTELVDMTIDQLDAGEVLIDVAHSTVNYKDALSATGAGRIIRRFPCVGGIDRDRGGADFPSGQGLFLYPRHPH